jgi:hypothetical protein
MQFSGTSVHHVVGTSGVKGLFAGQVLRALVDDLAVVHAQLARVHGISARDGLHM